MSVMLADITTGRQLPADEKIPLSPAGMAGHSVQLQASVAPPTPTPQIYYAL